MKKIFLLAALFAAVSVSAEKVFDWAGNVGSITATGTAKLDSKVKIHTDKDEVNAIIFENGYSIDTTKTPAEHTNYIELAPAEGTFKVGDVIKVEFCYNNKDSKVATVGVYDLEGTEIAASGEGVNAKFSDDLSVFNYEFIEDMEKVRLARAKTGKTKTYIVSLEVLRGEVVDVKALNPQFSVPAGEYFDPFKLGLSTTEEGAKIFCRLGGEGDFAEYADSIEIAEYDTTYIVEAFATREGALNSDTLKATYTLTHFVPRPKFDARLTIRLDSITADDIEILSGDNAVKSTYTMDGKTIPSVNYIHMPGADSPDSVMLISFKGRKELTLRYKNGTDKANALKVAAEYIQLDSKNYELWLDSVNPGDTVVFVVTAKGSAPLFDHAYSASCYINPYQPEDDTDPCFTDGNVFTKSDARVDDGYIGWTDLVYIVQEGRHSIKLKETANGARIAMIQIGAYRGEAPEPKGLFDAVEGTKAVKTFENGQLVIIKNGVRYNVLGTKL